MQLWLMGEMLGTWMMLMLMLGCGCCDGRGCVGRVVEAVVVARSKLVVWHFVL